MILSFADSKWVCAGVGLAAWFSFDTVFAQGTEPYDQPPLNYSSTKPQDAVADLQARSTAGKLRWAGSGREILEALLRELHVPVTSQILVFSKTSFQRHSIDPGHPRAIYFSDTCYVGWVPGGLIEVTSIDPKLGPIFYSFDPNANEPGFVRDSACMTCHGGMFVRGIPGVIARSVFPDATGEPLFRFGSQVVDFRTPFTNRWGGWYVTGKHGSTQHRGNVLAQDKNEQLIVNFEKGANITNLAGYFQNNAYPASGSDIVALLVFEHQIAMQNALTRASLDAQRMLAYQHNLQVELKENVTEVPTYDSVKHVFDGAAQDVTDCLLFRGEAPLPAGLEGDSAFQNAFTRESLQCDDGSSLREFSLSGRLFKNRCSYMIYSQSFGSLPKQLKRGIYKRLVHAVSAASTDPRYSYLPVDERERIARILRQTIPEYRLAVESDGG